MSERENKLFSHKAFLAAIYFDLRYQVLLSETQKTEAVEVLGALHDDIIKITNKKNMMLRDVESSESVTCNSRNSSSNDNNVEDPYDLEYLCL